VQMVHRWVLPVLRWIVPPPQPSVDTGDSLWDLMTHGAGFSVPGSAALSDAALTHGCSGVVGLRVSELLLPGSLGFWPHLLTRGGWRTT
jgi:hypothetical protein